VGACCDGSESMALRKKGVFYTFVALLFLSLLIFSTSIANRFESRQKSFAAETRIDTMNRFLTDVDKDIERAAYIAGFRSLLAIEEKVVNTGVYESNLDKDFRELFFNGTMNSTNHSLLANNTFNDWLEKIGIEAQKIDVIINLSNINASLMQNDPWLVAVNLSFEMLITDKKSTSSWKRQKSVSAEIEIEGFEDPFYSIGTGGIVQNTIRRTNFSYFVNGADVSNLLSHTYAWYYAAFSGAPSYLMRLKGDFGNSPYGIESLVDVPELISKGVSAKQKSIVDYIYFGSTHPVRYSVIGTPSWFKIDNTTSGNTSHHMLYEVEGLVS
jgi:hypothetical protein